MATKYRKFEFIYLDTEKQSYLIGTLQVTLKIISPPYAIEVTKKKYLPIYLIILLFQF